MAYISAAQATAAGIGGHDYWILYDDFGNKIQEIHGFAMNGGTVDTTAISGSLYATTGYTMTSIAQEVVLQGPLNELQAYWNAGIDCANLINMMSFDYNAFSIDILGYNSNNVYSTVGACMGVVPPNVGSPFTLTPGYGEVILNQSMIDSVQTANGIAGGSDRHKPRDIEDMPQFVPEDPAMVQIVGVQSDLA